MAARRRPRRKRFAIAAERTAVDAAGQGILVPVDFLFVSDTIQYSDTLQIDSGVCSENTFCRKVFLRLGISVRDDG